MQFKGENVLITGGSKGIGANIAKVLSKYNLKIWINYNSSEKNAVELKEKILIEEKNAQIKLIKFDVSKEKEFLNGISEIIKEDGSLDYLVNNAGITKDAMSIIMNTSDYDDVMNINARSCFIGCKEIGRQMAKNKFGSIVNVSSIAGQMGNQGQANYSASKGAMISMTKTFALELATKNVRVNSIAPGLIESDMTNSLKSNIKEEFLKKIPLGRYGKPEEVAHTVAFLLSDFSSFITGETIKINGGMYM